MKPIPFNNPFISGNELKYLSTVIANGKLCGNGPFTKKCQNFLEEKYGFQKVLLTTSCTDALEMAAILCNIKDGDEVIMPSYTFVSSANPFILRGAKIVFIDSSSENPNLDIDSLESLITNRTKAIVAVHYSGTSCDMDRLMKIASKYNLYLIEDAAQAIDSYYNSKPLGSLGHLAAFSFHETKNIISGEGGALIINDPKFIERSEIIWEKGTNRSAFFRGEINKYGWVDVGSSYLPSELNAGFLLAQLEEIQSIQKRRLEIWEKYHQAFKKIKSYQFRVNNIPKFNIHNGHIYSIIFESLEIRQSFLSFLKTQNIQATFHYQSLHHSLFYKDKHDGRTLKFADYYTDGLVRLPLFSGLSENEVDYIIEKASQFLITLK